MKLKVVLSSALAVFTLFTSFAQQTPVTTLTNAQYDNMKRNGTLPAGRVAFIGTPGGNNLLEKANPVPHPSNSVQASTACNCFQPLDNTFSIVPFTNGSAPEYRNDDGYTSEITLPFSFCLYGNTYNSLYINNNGNVSFGAPYSTFTANAFPDASFVMVAPFWADVDTRGAGSGLVYYKITNSAMIVRWQNVGYFNSEDDKLNDFQLIITNGNDSIIPIGSNVSFCYGDMQWTTGAASSGTNGFGGEPATVGANKGDGTNYVQFGRFDHAGTDYDGPFGNVDGVSWLDNQSFFFNVCSNDNNIAPIVSGATVCDTIDICVGTVLPINFSFLSPEQAQITTTTVSPNPGWNGNTTSGNTSTITGTFTGNNQNIGTNVLTFTGTDNGSPAASTVVTLVINVQPGPPVPTITGGAPFCPGQGQGMLIASPGYFSYTWSPGGGTNDTLIITQGGTYTVTVDSGGCDVTSIPFTANVFPLPSPVINGPAATCTSGNATLSINPAGLTDILWTPGNDTTASIIVPPGTYSVNVIDNNGCTGSSTFTVANSDPVVAITSSPAVSCFHDPVTLTAHAMPVGNNYSYSWAPVPGSDSTLVVPDGIYIVTITDPSGNCSASDTITIDLVEPSVAIAGNVPFCSGDSILLSTNNPFSDYQWFENGQPINGNNLVYADSGQYIVVVTDPYGCQTADTISIDPVANPIANFSTTPQFGGVQFEPLQFNDLSQFSTNPLDSIISWNWTFNSGVPSSSTNQNPISTYPITGQVDVTLIVTTEIGCKDTITIPVEIVPDIAPNVFTPNGDGINDTFVLPVAYVKPNCVLYVFNRWGRKLYQSDNYQNDWDGEGHTDGVYYFTFYEPDGKEHHGTVTILRNK